MIGRDYVIWITEPLCRPGYAQFVDGIRKLAPDNKERFLMAFVVTDACAKDFLCVEECATSAIAPTAADPAAGTVSQVYINPDECIDCGSCAAICPQEAIFSNADLPAEKAEFEEKNRAYFV